jgi:hypothetical protein
MRFHDRLNQVQLLTMSAVDFLDQWFETDVLKATMSASGIIGTFLGVRSPGTAYVLLHHYMGEIDGAFPIVGTVARRDRRGLERDCRRGPRAWRRDSHRSSGQQDSDEERPHDRRGPRKRRRDSRPAVVVSSVDPNLTFLKFIDERELPSDFVEGVRRYKYRGSSGKVNLALDALPDFTCMPGRGPALARRDLDLAELSTTWSALRRCEVRAVLAASVHRHGDPVVDRSLGGASRQARDVVLRAIRAVSLQGRRLGRSTTRRVWRCGHQRDRGVRAEHQEHHPAPAGADAARHRA